MGRSLAVRSLAILAFSVVFTARAQVDKGADLVLTNGKILTVDQNFRIAAAVAIRDGRFAAVGTREEIQPWIGKKTRVLDCQGKTVIPGLIDSHVHATGVASDQLSEFPYQELTSIAAVQEWIRQAAKTTPPGEWILVPRTFPTRLKDRRMPTRAELDAAAGLHPVLFDGAYSQVLNSEALRRVGIRRDSPQPPTGEIVKEERAEPTGLLRNGRQYLSKFLPAKKTSRDALLGQLEKVHQQYHSVGITSVIERSASLEQYRLYEDLHRQNRLHTRVRVTISLPSKNPDEAERFIRSLPFKPLQGDNWLGVGPLKITVDGGILTGTAYMREPYGRSAMTLFNLSDPQYRGSLSLSGKALTEVLQAGHRLGWPMAAHVTGDAGVDLVLDALEAASRDTAVQKLRFNLIHAYFPTTEAIQKAKALGVCVDTQPALYYKDADALGSALGRGRIASFIGVADWTRGGVVVAANTDHMFGLNANRALHPYNPFLTLYILVSRRTESGALFNEDQKVSREEALRMMTINAAYLSFDESRKGSIEVGKLADLVVLEEDYLTCPVERIREIVPVLTVVSGQIVFERAHRVGARK